MRHSLLTSLLNINSALSPHLAGQLHDLSTWLANSNFAGSKMFSLFHFLIFSLVNCGSSKNALANMNPSPRLRRRDSHFTTTVGPTTLPATVLVNCGFVFGSQRAKYICGRKLTYNDGTRDGTHGLTPQLARSSCVRCNPLELAHRISRERRERPQVRYLITRSFSEYSRRPGIKYPHVNPPHSHNTGYSRNTVFSPSA